MSQALPRFEFRKPLQCPKCHHWFSVVLPVQVETGVSVEGAMDVAYCYADDTKRVAGAIGPPLMRSSEPTVRRPAPPASRTSPEEKASPFAWQWAPENELNIKAWIRYDTSYVRTAPEYHGENTVRCLGHIRLENQCQKAVARSKDVNAFCRSCKMTCHQKNGR